MATAGPAATEAMADREVPGEAVGNRREAMLIRNPASTALTAATVAMVATAAPRVTLIPAELPLAVGCSAQVRLLYTRPTDSLPSMASEPMRFTEVRPAFV